MEKTIATICISLVVAGNIYSSNWNTHIEEAISNGSFAKASQIIDKLPQEIKSSNARSLDSMKIIMDRIKCDFSLTPEDGIKQIKKRIPNVTTEQIEQWKSKRQIEFIIIDGKEYWFRKAVRNLWLIDPTFAKNSDSDGYERLKYRDEALSKKKDGNSCYNWQNVIIKFTLDVNKNTIPSGEEIDAWLPIPITTQRQKNFKLISSSATPIYSQGSAHNTVMLTSRTQKDKDTHFEIVFSYDVAAQYFENDSISKIVKPYKTTDAEYIKYTLPELPHTVITDKSKELAKSIVGDEKNSVKQASLIYNWICQFPWAGARDYSTIPNIPEYVLENKHGDCGQVSLLYILLTRSIGIPSRWESGWMLHPGAKNYHDWAETYFEGIGWVPTDVSFGRNKIEGVSDYYKTGTDIYRLATNTNISKPLSPQKKFIRSETIDFQAGEVEWQGGNLETDKWDSKLEIISIKPINY